MGTVNEWNEVAAQLGVDLEPEERSRQLPVEVLGEVLGLVVGVRPEPFALVGAELPDPSVLEDREQPEQERHGGDGELGAGRTAAQEGSDMGGTAAESPP